jgi:hypothetical protein
MYDTSCKNCFFLQSYILTVNNQVSFFSPEMKLGCMENKATVVTQKKNFPCAVITEAYSFFFIFYSYDRYFCVIFT